MRWTRLLAGIFLLIINLTTFAANKTLTVLMLESQDSEQYQTIRKGFLDQLDKLGYVEGRNLEITRYSVGNSEGLATRYLLLELASRKHQFDVIYTVGTIPSLAAKKYVEPTQNVVFASVTDPILGGLIDNYDAPPSGNFTGIGFMVKVQDRFKLIKRLMPRVKTLGLVYADMPQGIAYRKRVENVLATDPNFKDLKVEFRSVPLAKGEQATKRMIMESRKYIEELNDKVDAFISPSDALGTDEEFPQMVSRVATKPLFGILKNDAADKRGAVAVIYPDLESMGQHAAVMVHQLFQGKSIKDIYPRWTDTGIAIDADRAKAFNLTIPATLQSSDSAK